MIFSSFIRLFDEETTISLEKVSGVAELPALTICPLLSPYALGETYKEFVMQKNNTINDLMRNLICPYDMIYASLAISTDYTTM
jgi:hypothetical protein